MKEGEGAEAVRFVFGEYGGHHVIDARPQQPGVVSDLQLLLLALDVRATRLQAHRVELAAEPVYEPVVGQPLALGLHVRWVGQATNDDIDLRRELNFESIQDQGADGQRAFRSVCRYRGFNTRSTYRDSTDSSVRILLATLMLRDLGNRPRLAESPPPPNGRFAAEIDRFEVAQGCPHAVPR